MIIAAGFTSTCKRALITFEWFLASVNSHVSIEIAVMCTSKRTLCAFERFLTGVSADMIIESDFLCTGIRALFAFEWFFTSVNTRVNNERSKILSAEQSKAIVNLTETNAKLTDALINAQGEAVKMASQLGEANSKPQYGQPPILTNLSNVLTDAIAEGELRREKSKRAVIEKLPEKPDNDQTAISDKEFVKQIVQTIGIPDNEVELEATHRHGTRNPNPDRHRPIKVQFNSTKVRNQFLYSYYSAMKSLRIQLNATVRRDMTPTELKILYAQRQKAYSMNAECGMLKYHVVDLDIRENKNPKMLRKQNVNDDK